MKRNTSYRVLIAYFVTLLLLSSLAVAQPHLSDISNAKARRHYRPHSLPFTSGLFTSRVAAQSAGFVLPLKDGLESRFHLIERKTIRVPIIDSANRVSESIRVVVDRVSNFAGIEGTLVHKTGERGFGVYGSFLDVSSAEGRSWSLRPEGEHEEVMPQHVIEEQREGSESAALEPLALLKQLEEIVRAEGPEPSSQIIESESGESNSGESNPGVLALENVIREVQLVVVSSGDYSGTRTNDQLVAEVVSIVGSADTFFDVLRLRIGLVGVQIFRPGSGDPFSAATAARDGLAMLEKVRELWRQRTAPEHDITAVFGRSAYTGISGLGYPDASCRLPQFSFLFATQGGTGQGVQGLAVTLAHEIGHVIGMSHDEMLVQTVPSLMWPFFIPSPGGFSDFSIQEYEAHVARDGSACFSAISALGPEPDPDDDVGVNESFRFVDENKVSLSVSEGQLLSRRFPVTGTTGSVRFRAQGLPEGAAFSVDNGLISYEPGFDVANRVRGSVVFEVDITASSGASSASLLLTIEVKDTNRAPVLLFDGPRVTRARVGETLRLVLQAQDSDSFDSASAQLLSNLNGVFLGTHSVEMLGANLVVSLQPTVVGSYSLLFAAQDLGGLRSLRELRLLVEAENLAPVLRAPDEFKVSDTGEELIIEAEDPEEAELTFDFLGLPSGSIVTLESKRARIDFDPEALRASDANIEVYVGDGTAVTSKRIRIAQTSSVTPLPGRSSGGRWPGKSSSARNQSFADTNPLSSLTLYDSSTGTWRHSDCNGESREERNFGGFLGDLPIRVKAGAENFRGIYRTELKQGYWYTDTPQGTEVVPWGLEGDIPVPGDFDGDGLGDYAVFRPADPLTGKDTWYIKFTAIPEQALSDTVLGAVSTTTRFPYAADVDGDGRDDRILISRKLDGSVLAHVWFADGAKRVFSLGGVTRVGAFVPLVADFDADGRSEFAIRSSEGVLSGVLSTSSAIFSRQLKAGAARVFSSVQCAEGNSLALSAQGGESLEIYSAEIGTLSSSDSSARTEILDTVRLTSLESAAASFALRKLRAVFADTDNDGASNIAVRRSSLSSFRGVWLEQKLLAAGLGFDAVSGASGQLASGDFFGGGSAALSFFDRGVWNSQLSDGSTIRENWGVSGDQAVVADYNADGRSEYAVWRPADGSWWMLSKGELERGVGDTASLSYWGESGDIPVPADYDGDGAADVAIWRPSSGQWFIRYADGSVEVVKLGTEEDIPMPGDYLGESRTRPAVWRPSLGLWIIKRGERAEDIVVVPWGLPSDLPVKGDFDGDGRDDLAVWREAEGNWYIRRVDSLDPEIKVIQFGLPGDIPLGAGAQSSLF